MSLEIYNKNIGKIKLIPLDYKSKKDYKLFKEIVCDINIMKTSSLFDSGISKNENEIRQYFEIMSKSNFTHNIGFYKLIDKNKNFIGISGLILINKDKNNEIETLEIGYFLKGKYYNKKIGSNIADFLVNFAFNNFKTTKKILGTALVDNIPSQIIMLKSGFKYLGQKLKRNSIINYYSINRNDFNKKDKYIKSSEYYKNMLLKLNSENKINHTKEKVDESII